MPTSAAGNKDNRPPVAFTHERRRLGLPVALSARRTRGFSLLELMVVIAIMAFATAGVGFAMRDTQLAVLEREADRLAALLDSARAHSRASGAAVRWRQTEDGFVFEGLPPNTLPNHWLSAGISSQAFQGDGRQANVLLLGPDPIIPAQQLLLTLDSQPPHSLRLATDGLRPFAVTTP